MAVSKQNFFQAHWDWLVLIAGLVALAVSVVFLLPALGKSPDTEAERFDAQLGAVRPAHEGVAAADLGVLKKAFTLMKTPPKLREVDAKKANFLASERRILCQNGDAASKQKACGKPIPADSEICPLCGVKQNVVKVEVDTDHDGMPNAWEKKYGFNPEDPADAAQDADGDGFTNLEEYQAGTDPRDANSHPDYLDFLAVSGELRHTELPFYFNDYQQLPKGYRYVFQRIGKTGYDSKVSAKMNEEIASMDGRIKTGWKVTGFTRKTEQVAIKGSKTGAKKNVDVSTVDLVRVADGKKMKIQIQVKANTVESQADLVYGRGDQKKYTVSEGTEFELVNGKNRSKYRVEKLKNVDGKCQADVVDLKTRTKKSIQ